MDYSRQELDGRMKGSHRHPGPHCRLRALLPHCLAANSRAVAVVPAVVGVVVEVAVVVVVVWWVV